MTSRDPFRSVAAAAVATIANSTPPLTTGSRVSYDIPLADLTGLAATAHLAQLIISGDPNTVYVDNVYFHR